MRRADARGLSRGGRTSLRSRLIRPQRVNVLGVGVSAINMDDALEFVASAVAEDVKTYICVCNVHSVMECQRSPELKEVFAAAGLVTPDGMPLVWLGRR